MTYQPPTQTVTRQGPVSWLRRLAGRSRLVKWLLIIIGLAVMILIAKGVLYFMVLWSLGDPHTDDTIPCDCPEFEQAALDVPWPGASESYILGTTSRRSEGGSIRFTVAVTVRDATASVEAWFSLLEDGIYEVIRDSSDPGDGRVALPDLSLILRDRPEESRIDIQFGFDDAERPPDETLQPLIDLLTEG
jgi:hypothetical protein